MQFQIQKMVMPGYLFLFQNMQVAQEDPATPIGTLGHTLQSKEVIIFVIRNMPASKGES